MTGDRYDELRAERPERFRNPPGAPIEIVFDPAVRAEVAGRSGDLGVVYEDDWFIAVRDAVRFRDGHTGPYFRLLGRHDGAGAVVLPRLADGRILLLRQFRHAQRDWLWVIPRGFAEPGDSGPATAIRELREETGVSGAVELIGRIAAEGDLVEYLLSAVALATASGRLVGP